MNAQPARQRFRRMNDTPKPLRPAPRLFVPHSVAAGDDVSLDTARAHYVHRVLRLSVGDRLTVFDDGDFDYPATIISADKRQVTLTIGEGKANQNESPLAVRLLQGIARGDRMDFVVQKATELGVREIVPVLTDFSVVRLSAARAERRRQHWQNIARSACEQCGRSRVPAIAEPTDLLPFLQIESDATTRLMFSPVDAPRLAELSPGHAPLDILIGPEGGLSKNEVELAQAVGFRAVSLGPRTLRTETAAIAALAALQAYWGDG